MYQAGVTVMQTLVCANGNRVCSQIVGDSVRCVCEAGYAGADCNSTCALLPNCLGSTTCDVSGTANLTCAGQCVGGFYGADCASMCTQGNCLGTVSCDQSTGANRVCIACESGFFGQGCTQACDAGNCANDTVSCAFADGSARVCTSGCLSGYYGGDCESPCVSLAQCTGTPSCDAVSGVVEECELCVDGRWGVTCEHMCVDSSCHSSVTPSCDKATGTTASCAQCSAGRWGATCNQLCLTYSCPSGLVTCNQATGVDVVCSGACHIGSYGVDCNSPCAQGQCNTMTRVSCDKNGGGNRVCTACNPGYFGTDCDSTCATGNCIGTVSCNQNGGENRVCTACRLGFTGTNCTNFCAFGNCLGAVACDINGNNRVCQACANGFTGPDCNLMCAQGNCQGVVSCAQDGSARSCPTGCVSGFTGGDCSQLCPAGTCVSGAVVCEQHNAAAVTCSACQNGYYGTTCNLACGCFGHAAACDKDTGVCIGCANFTTGDSCNLCVTGSYGDATQGPCIKCPSVSGCATTITCENATSSYCAQCSSGFYHDRPSGSTASVCAPCPNAASLHSQCTEVSSNCTLAGEPSRPTCVSCVSGYYTDPSAGCLACDPIVGCASVTCFSGGVSFCVECDTVGFQAVSHGTEALPQSDTCELVDCGAPHLPVNVTLATCSAANAYASTCTVGCPTGFRQSGPSSIECRANATWSEFPTCDIVDCGALTVTNGAVSCDTGNTLFGTVCVIGCDTGYTRDGGSTRTCLASGQWSNPPASGTTCSRVDCGVPMLPPKTLVTCPNTKFGDTCAVSCETGHQQMGTVGIECQANGTWTPLPTCVIVDCFALSIDSGSASCLGGTTFGETCTVSCSAGYTLAGAASRVCQESGVWSNGPSSCAKTVDWCPAQIGATALANGALSACTNRLLGDSCAVACQAGYDFHNGTQWSCDSTGSWSGSGSCVPKDCGSLGLPATLVFASVCLSTTFGFSCSLSCATGHSLASSASLLDATCQSDGTWTPLPTCNIVDCGALSLASGSVLCTNGTTFGSLCALSCDTGYTLQGSATRLCQAQGTWSDQSASCVATANWCPGTIAAGTTANSAMSTCDSQLVGSTCTVDCDIGYVHQGSNQWTCDAVSRQWTGSGVCVPRACGTLNTPANGLPLTCSAGSVYPSVCSGDCADGYFHASGSKVRSCQSNAVWSGAPLECQDLVQRVQMIVDNSAFDPMTFLSVLASKLNVASSRLIILSNSTTTTTTQRRRRATTTVLTEVNMTVTAGTPAASSVVGDLEQLSLSPLGGLSSSPLFITLIGFNSSALYAPRASGANQGASNSGSTVGVSVGAAVAAVLLIAIVAIAAVLYMRRRGVAQLHSGRVEVMQSLSSGMSSFGLVKASGTGNGEQDVIDEADANVIQFLKSFDADLTASAQVAVANELDVNQYATFANPIFDDDSMADSPGYSASQL